MLAHRLQRVADRGPGIAIVDHQRGAALRHQPLGELTHHRDGGGRRLQDRARGCVAQRLRHDRVEAGGAGDRQEQRVLAGDQPLAPAVRSLDELADGQGVEKLVGHHQQRTVVGDPHQVDVPFGVGHALLLRGAQRGARFDEVHLRLEPCARHGAQRIGRQRSPARPELDVAGRRPSGAVPGVGKGQPHQFAEHLADLGRGREVAARAQRIAAVVIMGVRRPHELRQRDWPAERDRAGEPVGERPLAQATLSDPAIGSMRWRRPLAVTIR